MKSAVLYCIANSSMPCDMLQNDLKFISNKSFWLYVPLPFCFYFLSFCSFSTCLSFLLWPMFTCIERHMCNHPFCSRVVMLQLKCAFVLKTE